MAYYDDDRPSHYWDAEDDVFDITPADLPGGQYRDLYSKYLPQLQAEYESGNSHQFDQMLRQVVNQVMREAGAGCSGEAEEIYNDIYSTITGQ